MPAKKTAATSSSTRRSRVTAALRKTTGAVAKATGRRAAPAEAATQKTVTKKSTTKKATTRKTPATKKAVTSKPAAAKTAKKAAPAKKAAASKSTARKAAATKSASAQQKVAEKKSTAKKSTAAATAKPAAKKTSAKKTGKTAAKKTAATSAAPTKKATTNTTTQKAAQPASKTTPKSRSLKVRDDESPWTAKELAAVRAELEGDVERLRHELSGFEADIAGLIKDGGDGAGDDEADTGAKNFEREHEYSLAQNSRDLLEQSVHALERIDDSTYGVCENCGNAIGKLRLQAFPRATLCLNCKAKQERR